VALINQTLIKQMKLIHVKNLFIFILILVIVVLLVKLNNQLGLYILATINGAIFIFSSIVRKKTSFKNFFTSKYNLLTTKFRKTQEFDFPKDLLFEKFVEVLESTGFKITETNKETGDLFAISSVSFSSWGENIYITLEEQNDHTTMNFCSTTFFQIYSWGKNERNYERMFNQFEESLII
jgi:hypothetical protein